MKFSFFIFLLFSTVFVIQGQEKYSILSIPTQFTKNANSVVIHKKVGINVSEDKLEIQTERATTVLNERGDRNVSAIAYYDETRTIEKIEAYVYDALGNEVEHFKKNDFRDISVADGFSIFNDNRALYLEYTPTSYPYTIVFKSIVETGDTAFIMPWFPIDRYAESVLYSEQTITFDPSNKVRYKKEHIDGFEIKITETEETLRFVAENIKAFRYEELSPAFTTFCPKVYFGLDTFSLQGVPGYGKNWSEFGQWMYSSLLSDVSELPEGTKQEIRNLVASETTDEGKARKIYQYVQDKVRYISVQVGIGGWKPMLATEVDNLSYGDCKALTNYTKALLEVVGVTSYYTVLYAGDDERDIMSDFSSMQGNHVILGIPTEDEITWLECTSQDTPYGYLGNFTDDRDVVIITPQGGKVVHTKTYTQQENVQANTGNIIIGNDGSATASLTSVSEGLQYDGKYALEKLKKEELLDVYKNRWGNLNGLSVESIILKNNKEDIQFTEEVKLKIPSITSKVGNEMLLELNSFNQASYIPPRITDRKQKLALEMAYTDIDEVTITLPKNLNFDSLPENKLLETKFGRYSIEVESLDNNTIQFKRKLYMNKGTFAPEDYKEYRSFRRAIAKQDKLKILIKPIE
ncbi:DUF3857 domain-containing protein [Jejudonia soesokkakensis]|uniref:DUF3857 domain-containing protein n=1 Tax=Jejudonia soesokkakensis TaxID=1323432 RepID=A0ABW2MVE6_9FLAO